MRALRPPGLTRVALAGAIGAAAVAAIVAISGEDANGGGATDAASKRWLALAPSPLARTEVGAARIGRFVYVVGGFAPPGADTTDQVARYDIDSDSWQLIDPLPVAVNHAAVTSHRGRLFVHGGDTGAGATDALQRYDPASGNWTLLEPSGPGRAAGTLAAVRGKLYAIGGVSDRELRLVEVYDIATDSWRNGRPMKVPRHHLASAVSGRRIVVMGGRAGSRNLGVVERLNTRTGRWVKLPRLRVRRSGFQAATVRGRVVVAGGEQLQEGDHTIAAVELYQPRRKRWRRLAPMLTPRHGLGLVARGRRVFALEGGPQPGLAYSSALEFLDVPKRLLRRR